MTIYTEKGHQFNHGAGRRAFDVLRRTFRQWNQSRRLRVGIAGERRQLSELPAELLRDIGVSRADANVESRRRDVPLFRTGC